MFEIIPNWHPLFVHFTVALFSLSLLFFIIQRPLAETEIGDNFLVFARYSLGLGILFTVATLIAGIDAYNTVDHDDPSHLAMKDHRLWAFMTAGVFLVAWLWSLLSLKNRSNAGWLLLIILVAGGGLLVVTGHKGSQLVYYYGLGVESLPETDDHDHSAHDHGDGHGHGDDAHDHGDGKSTQEHSHEKKHDEGHAHDDEHSHDKESSTSKTHVHADGKVHTHAGEATPAKSVTDKDGIKREELPAVEMPLQPVEE